MRPRGCAVLACLSIAAATPVPAAEPVLPPSSAYQTPDNWRQPVAPFQMADNTWYVGTEGISALLVKTPQGALLIDGGLPQAAGMLLRHLRDLGVAPGELKWILHSHAHGDHAGPIAAIQRATGARVVSNAESAALLARGGSDDLHFGDDIVFPGLPVAQQPTLSADRRGLPPQLRHRARTALRPAADAASGCQQLAAGLINAAARGHDVSRLCRHRGKEIRPATGQGIQGRALKHPLRPGRSRQPRIPC
jgi:hypothetical protein